MSFLSQRMYEEKKWAGAISWARRVQREVDGHSNVQWPDDRRLTGNIQVSYRGRAG